MTQPPQPAEPFAQDPGLAELVTALGFRRYPLFLAGLLYQEPGGPLRRVTAVASRDGDLVAYDAGEVFEHAGRVPTSRLFDDDLTGRSPEGPGGRPGRPQPGVLRPGGGRVNQGRRSVNEVGIALLHHWFLPPRSAPPASTGSEVLGWFRWRSPTPCWTSSAAWPTATSAASWSSTSWSCSPRADPGRFTMSGAAEGS